jgi:LmbE family N-acetylglucosaminyl deacetylase
MDSVELLTIVKIVENILGEIRPDIVYTHHGGDLNVDHGLAHAVALTACRPVPGETVASIGTFETMSSTEWGSLEQQVPFRPSHFLGIQEYLPAILEALKWYAKEMRPFPYTRSLEAIEANTRARDAEVGLVAAEAFSAIHQVRA